MIIAHKLSINIIEYGDYGESLGIFARPLPQCRSVCTTVHGCTHSPV